MREKLANPVPIDVTVDPTALPAVLEDCRGIIKAMLAEVLEEHRARFPAQPGADARQTAAPAQPAVSPAGVVGDPVEQRKASDLRCALLTGRVPEDVGLLIDTEVFARLRDLSIRTLERLHAEGVVLAPVELGKTRIKKWRLHEIREWIEAGCPPRRSSSYEPQRPSRSTRR